MFFGWPMAERNGQLFHNASFANRLPLAPQQMCPKLSLKSAIRTKADIGQISLSLHLEVKRTSPFHNNAYAAASLEVLVSK
jgi:hypothetical protein